MSTVTIQVTKEIVGNIMADVRGQGGFQNLLRKLQGQLNLQSCLLTLETADLETIPRYHGYEPGGYEDRLLHAFGFAANRRVDIRLGREGRIEKANGACYFAQDHGNISPWQMDQSGMPQNTFQRNV
jgi:hypothetical protein